MASLGTADFPTGPKSPKIVLSRHRRDGFGFSRRQIGLEFFDPYELAEIDKVLPTDPASKDLCVEITFRRILFGGPDFQK